MLKRVMEEPETKALLILPYVALVQEKVRWLRSVVQGLSATLDPDVLEQRKATSIWQTRPDHDSIKVVGFFGGVKIRSSWQDFDIAICTLEKVCVLYLAGNTQLRDLTSFSVPRRICSSIPLLKTLPSLNCGP